MNLSTHLLDTFDKCERRFAFSQKYEPKLITPLGLLYHSLNAAIISPDPAQSAKDAAMRMAARREMVTGDINKFTTIRHLEALAGIIATAVQQKLGILTPLGEVNGWDSALYRSSNNILHRIELVSHFDDDRLRACAHSWRVIGEMAALRSPINLVMIVIGAQRGGRRHSAWTRGLLHPVNKALRFAPRNAKKKGFGDTWNHAWREQHSEISTLEWLNQMKKDDVLDDLIHSRSIAYRHDDHRMIAAREEMFALSLRMSTATLTAPMRRSACDEWGGCPFANVCYSSIKKSPEDFPHLYLPLDSTHAGQEECKPARDNVVVLRPVQAVRGV